MNSDQVMSVRLALLAQEALKLEEVARVASTDPQKALALLDAVDDSGLLSYLRVAAISVIHSALVSSPKELDFRSKFYRELHIYLPGAVKSKVATIGKNVPDGFVIWRNRECPVEIKRLAFDERALHQLQRYMTVYDAEMGIAVAPELRCGLPENVHFVEVSLD